MRAPALRATAMQAAVGRLRAVWLALVGSWPALSTAAIAWSLWLAPQPLTWRRPVVDEFWRFAALAGPGSLVTMLVAAALVGVALVGQGLFWLQQIGQDVVTRTLLVLLIREVTPLVVGLVTLGRAGLFNLTELGAMRANGTIRVLEARGLDPLLLLAAPRILALGLCTLAHAVVFLSVAVLAGHLFATLLGVAAGDFVPLVRRALRILGEIGVFVLPVKTLLIGFAIAAVTTVSALSAEEGRDQGFLLAGGFFRALLALFVITLVGSLAL